MSAIQMTTHAQPSGPQVALRSPRARQWVLLIPLLVFGGIGVFLAIGLGLDPHEIPSALIGKPVPTFSLPPVRGQSLGLASADLKGEVSLVNVFASWCVACREEHLLLMQIRRDGVVPVHGLDYKDPPADAERWLQEMGDPYTRTGADLDGRVAIDWGVYGVPETFVVDAEGMIAYKHIGAITPVVWTRTLLPLIRTLQKGSP
jgi:cytochrome c biogenesis protein CcmG/thiol:disulfide interchange protein DsbE